MKATKIVCTLGPASEDPGVMGQMLQEGMNVARLNCSHGSHEEHLERINTFRQVSEELGIPAAVLLDTKGPEIRLGTFGENKVHLEKGQTFVLRSPAKAGQPGTKEGVSISYEGLASEVGTGTRIVDSFFEAAQAQDVESALTLSCTDLSKIQAVEQGLDGFFGVLSKSLDAESFSELSNLRQDLQKKRTPSSIILRIFERLKT